MKVSAPFCFFMALMVLLHHPVAALNWQGTGSFDSENFADIWSFINANFKRYSDMNALQTFNLELSNTLNAKWDPAWNIVTMSISITNLEYNDVILYGYAFRQHWLWYNGYEHP